MDIDAKEIKSIVVTMMAKEIIAKLDTEARDAILAKSVADSLGEYTFRSKIENTVADKAAEIADEMLHSEEWTAKITAAVKEGFDLLLQQLPAAVFHATANAIAGEDRDNRGYGGSAGKIRSLLKLPTKDDDDDDDD